MHTYVEATVRIRQDPYRYGFAVDSEPERARGAVLEAIDAGSHLMSIDGGDSVPGFLVDRSSIVALQQLDVQRGAGPLFTIDGVQLHPWQQSQEAAIESRRTARVPKLSAAEAFAALRWLRSTGELKEKPVTGALSKRDQLVAEIRRQLERLGGQGARFLTSIAALRRAPGARRRRRKAFVKAVAAWRLQGAYMSAVRGLSKADRAKVKAIRMKSGFHAAIAAARRLTERS